jgi:hypothetical protein
MIAEGGYHVLYVCSLNLTENFVDDGEGVAMEGMFGDGRKAAV